jgi:transposase
MPPVPVEHLGGTRALAWWAVRKIPWGVRAASASASTGDDVPHGRLRERTTPMPSYSQNLPPNHLQFFVGIDWGSQQHRVCLLNREGAVLGERAVEHSGDGLAELLGWLRRWTSTPPGAVAVAIEIPRGALVESLVEQGFAVFSLNPKQLDRFRDRYSPAGAKDDRRDAFVLADALRTDLHCFHPVRLDDPTVIRLRELSRLEDDVAQEQNRLCNQLREQWHRFFPQLLQLSPAADEPWIWELFQWAPSPAPAARIAPRRLARLLRRHRIRRWEAPQVLAILASTPLTLAPGAAEAASEHALLLLPRLRLLHQQRLEITHRVEVLLEELATPQDPASPSEHRDAAVLLSLPGIGRQIAATMLSEASQAIAERDYHALRSYAGSAPVTRQSGKRAVVLMRQGCNERLRNALYHWSRVSVACDPHSKKAYAQMRARGHSHGRALRGMADRWLAVLISMLRHHTLYDPERRAA